MYDIIIIGSGPAGVSAASFAAGAEPPHAIRLIVNAVARDPASNFFTNWLFIIHPPSYICILFYSIFRNTITGTFSLHFNAGTAQTFYKASLGKQVKNNQRLNNHQRTCRYNTIVIGYSNRCCRACDPLDVCPQGI